MLLIGLASCLLLLPILAVRHLARHRRRSGDIGDSGAKRKGSRPATQAVVECYAALGDGDAALRMAMKDQIQEIRSLPEILPPSRLSTNPISDQDHTER
jgi:hypothetical protein